MTLSSLQLAGQTSSGDELAYPGSDVVLPKLAKQVDPTYSDEALEARIQGEIVIAGTIDRKGILRDPIILSPLGRGLNEQALTSLSKWRFKPATRDGNAVNFRATFVIRFRMDRAFDDREEKGRTGAIAVATLLSRQENGKPSNDSIQLLRYLAEGDWEQAQYQVGLWQIKGDVLAKDDITGLTMMRKSAENGFPPAMVFVGDALLDGRGLLASSREGLAFLRKAAARGSIDAEQDLGRRFMDGKGVRPNTREARKYLKLCSEAGRVECQTLVDQLPK